MRRGTPLAPLWAWRVASGRTTPKKQSLEKEIISMSKLSTHEKRVTIEIYGGVPEVIECPPDVEVEIIDHDHWKKKLIRKSKLSKQEKRITIEIYGGFAEVIDCPPDVEVEIIDHDN
jgi:hypothetical protein